MKKYIMVSFYAVLFFANSLFAETVEKNVILKNMIEVYGGSSALSHASSYIQHWKVMRSTDGIEGKDTRRITLPDRLYVHLEYPDKKESRILEGETGIKIFNGNNKRQAFGPVLDAMKVQLMRLYNPLVLFQFSNDLKISRKDSDYILTLSRNGVECDYYVNTRNFHIEKTVGKLKMYGNTMKFITLYKEFVKKEGVLMPAMEIKFAGKVKTAVNRLIDTKFIHLEKVGKHRYERI